MVAARAMGYPISRIKRAEQPIGLYRILRKNGGMSTKVIPFLEPGDGEPDYFDFDGERSEQPPSHKPASRQPKPKWTPQIVDDWPEEMPVFVEELELYELYFGEELDEILGFKK
jgi:hypothetical protein